MHLMEHPMKIQSWHFLLKKLIVNSLCDKGRVEMAFTEFNAHGITYFTFGHECRWHNVLKRHVLDKNALLDSPYCELTFNIVEIVQAASISIRCMSKNKTSKLTKWKKNVEHLGFFGISLSEKIIIQMMPGTKPVAGRGIEMEAFVKYLLCAHKNTQYFLRLFRQQFSHVC